MKIKLPIPAASMPGTSTTPRVGPPSPEASIRRKALRSGDPKSALIAAKLPADPITFSAIGDASRFASFTAITPSPPPSAISGASGPRTTPRPNPASAARSTPGSWTGDGLPPTWKPSAGEWPPFPGR